jgi:hypothetical protein
MSDFEKKISGSVLSSMIPGGVPQQKKTVQTNVRDPRRTLFDNKADVDEHVDEVFSLREERDFNEPARKPAPPKKTQSSAIEVFIDRASQSRGAKARYDFTPFLLQNGDNVTVKQAAFDIMSGAIFDVMLDTFDGMGVSFSSEALMQMKREAECIVEAYVESAKLKLRGRYVSIQRATEEQENE